MYLKKSIKKQLNFKIKLSFAICEKLSIFSSFFFTIFPENTLWKGSVLYYKSTLWICSVIYYYLSPLYIGLSNPKVFYKSVLFII